jgi:hypothetical protein
VEFQESPPIIVYSDAEGCNFPHRPGGLGSLGPQTHPQC